MSLTSQFWSAESETLRALLVPIFFENAFAGVAESIAEAASFGITFDEALAPEAAQLWAQNNTDRVLEAFRSVTEKGTGKVISEWLGRPGATRKELEDALATVLDGGAVRASRIAVTETTRALAQGSYIGYEAAGITKPPMFDRGMGGEHFGPPLHPNCRCNPRVARLARGIFVSVWTTRRDELVCITPFPTPWGETIGCRGMHNKVLSDGPYAGMPLGEARVLARENVKVGLS